MPDAATTPAVPNLFITNFAFDEADRARLLAVLGAEHALFVARPALRETLAAHPEADVLCTYNPPDDLFTLAPRLRWVALSSAGAERVVARGLVRLDGPVVTTASGVHAAAISEHVFGLLLIWVRGWREMLALQQAGTWPNRGVWPALQPGELHGATLGIVGLGAIGRALARLGRAFGMRVLATRHSAQAGETDPDVDTLYPLTDLHTLLAVADYVVLAAPATAESRHLIGPAELAVMRPRAFLVNIARGALVDEPALIAALESGRIGGAGLDVFEREPLPAESSLWHLPNVILSPHVAGSTEQYSRRLTDLLLENVALYRAGRPLRNVVQPARGY
jgi:phosphoglycerate dehydrogenase-like enzyme